MSMIEKRKAPSGARALAASCIVAALVAGFSGSLFAQEVAGLLQTIAQGQGQLEQSAKNQGELVQQNETELRVYKTYADNHKELNQRVERIEQAFAGEVQRRNAPVNQEVDQWNGQCSERSAGKLQPGPYQRCQTWRGQIESKQSAVKGDLQRQAEEIQRTQIAPLRKAQEKQKAAMEEISARMKQRLAAWEAGKKAMDETRRRLEDARNKLALACGHLDASPNDSRAEKQRKLEALHLCHSVGWDGANRNLPPLKDIRPPFAANSR